MKTFLICTYILLGSVCTSFLTQTVPDKKDVRKKKDKEPETYVIQGNDKAYKDFNDKQAPPIHKSVTSKDKKVTPADSSAPHK